MVSSRRAIVIGAGGREHALVSALLSSPSRPTVEAIPGHAGMSAEVVCHALDVSDHRAVRAVCEGASLVVIGPEQPLVDGLADALREAGIPVLGPNRAAAELEGSKSFAKQVMDEVGVPTARWARCMDAASAKAAAAQFAHGAAIKVDGLAAGKGVIVAQDPQEAFEAIDALMGADGATGQGVVVEERLEGPELSVIALCDGERLRVFPPAQDHKRLLEGDEGPNTGGMGAYAPAPAGTQEVVDAVLEQCIRPVIQCLRERGTPLLGVVYAGVMLTSEGPKVLEYNVRFGDPETQALLPMVSEDLFVTFRQAAIGELEPGTVATHPGAAMTVVLASPGYPRAPKSGQHIYGLEDAESMDGVAIYHAGTARDSGGDWVTAGGRVLGVTARGNTLMEAAQNAYRGVRCVRFDGMQYRRDIGYRALRTAVGYDSEPKGF